MAREKSKGYIVPHTHWDREWRYPIWKTRYLLVELIDEILEAMDKDPKYRCFLMDGQSVPIEDYLLVRPEMEEKIRKYVSDGRLSIGPWYTLPDLYPLDGECLVRNLLKGIRLADNLGGHLDIGYTSFGWGQTAQFPQIYAGFGLDFIVTAKIVSKSRAPECEFMWEAPDGTRVLTTRLGDHGRHSAFMKLFIPALHGIDYFGPNYTYTPEIAGVAFHRADEERSDRDWFKVAMADAYQPELLPAQLEKAWEASDATVAKNHRLLLMGCDFTSAVPLVTRIIEDLNSMQSEIELEHTTLREYVEAYKKSVDLSKLRVVKGELRDGPPSSGTLNAQATRAPIKMLNKKVQNQLIHVAEPLCAISALMADAPYPKPFLDLAWRYILKAHPHDSINGVTQDKTVSDVMYRLNQSLELADVAAEHAVGSLLKSFDLKKYDPHDSLVVVFNPSWKPRQGVLKLTVDTPQTDNVWDFTCEDLNGKPVRIQDVSRKEKVAAVHDKDARPWSYYVDRHEIYLDTGEVPSGGCMVYRLLKKNSFGRKGGMSQRSRRIAEESILKADNLLENEHLQVRINNNGTFDVTHKESGRIYRELNYFEDSGDNANYWLFYPPYNNKTYTTRQMSPTVWVEDNGLLSATVGIRFKMMLPAFALVPENAAGFHGESRRSDEERELTITTYVTLRSRAKRVDIRTVIDNTVEDHRMRVMFPTGIKTDKACAAGHFTVDQRPVKPQKDENGDILPEMQQLPHQYFVDLSDGKHGLALINNCICEYEAMNDAQRTCALTLFRSTRNALCTDGPVMSEYPKQKGSQLLQKMEFEYAVYPHAGDWEEGRVHDEAVDFNVPLVPVQTIAHKLGALAPGFSAYALKSDKLVISCLKKAEDRDSFVVRLYNPSPTDGEGVLVFDNQVKKAFLTNLNEERERSIPVTGGHRVKLSAAPHKIVTVELEFA